METSGQDSEAGSRQVNLQEAGVGLHTDRGTRTPYERDVTDQMKLLARNLTPEDLDDVVKTLLKIKDDRNKSASSTMDSIRGNINMHTGTNNDVRSKLDFSLDSGISAHRGSAPQSRESGYWTRESGVCDGKGGNMGIDNFSSRTGNFFRKSGLEALADGENLPEVGMRFMESGLSGKSRVEDFTPDIMVPKII